MKSKMLNILLTITLLVTIMAPVTGIMIHKLSSTLFLILSLIHTLYYRKTLNLKKYLLLAVVFIAFVSGIFGMIFDEISLILALHKVISIVSVAFLAIHIYGRRK